MESSNSGSMQSSSSGADNEDYSSHAESFSSILNLPPPQPPPPQLMASHHYGSYSTATTPPLFDPLSPFFAHFPPFPPPPPDPNPFGHFVDPATRPKPNGTGRSTPSPTHPNCTTAVDVSATSASSISSTRSPVQQSDDAAAATAPRGSKKRSRASRRAPTTVLTTDTSNFRAMVQQFTGFPVPPFAPSSSSAYSRPRLDLFNLGASASSASPYNNLLRPFAQKFQHPLMGTSSSSSSLIDAIASIARSSAGHLDVPLNTAGSASTSAPPFHASASSSRNLQFSPSNPQTRSPIHAQNASIDSHSIFQPQDISKLYASQPSPSSLPSFRAQQQGLSGGALQTAPQGVKTTHRTDGASSWIGRQSTESRDEARQELTNQSFGAYKASE